MFQANVWIFIILLQVIKEITDVEENIPNVEVKIYEKIGHLPMYEAPQRTARDIKDFAESVGGG